MRRLRQLSRPPLGRIPGIFYACFNLFCLGEEVQTLRDKAATFDYARQNALVAAGWTVLRFTAADLRHGAAPAVAQVLALLRAAA